MVQTSRLAQRALLAVALMAGFYGLAILFAGALLLIPYAQWTISGRVGRLAVYCVPAALGLIWAVMPRVDRFAPPGPRLNERSHPELFRAIREIAGATQQEMPSEVYLVNEVNAWVTHRGGIMGVGSRRVMGIGLPLLQGLNVSELKAVLAHEFGHYAAGDVKLGPWVYKTRTAIGRAITSLGESWLAAVFKWYGHLFLRLTHAVSQQQEFAADALAARTVHPAAMASALRRVEGLAPAFNAYWHDEVVPALDGGCLPPLAEGFNQFLGSERVSSSVTQLVATAESADDADALDTHPPLRQRLAALAGISGSTPPAADDPPAETLLRDPEGHARRLLEFAAGTDFFVGLRRVNWMQVTAEVYPRRWQEAAQQHAAFLGRFTADALPGTRAEFESAGSGLVAIEQSENPELAAIVSDIRVVRACQLLAVGVALALLDVGASLESSPGRSVVFRRGDLALEPFPAVQRLAEGKLSLGEWQRQCRAIGIAGRPLRPQSRT
jgi:Zn-dependent protease with chaperone function